MPGLPEARRIPRRRVENPGGPGAGLGWKQRRGSAGCPRSASQVDITPDSIRRTVTVLARTPSFHFPGPFDSRPGLTQPAVYSRSYSPLAQAWAHRLTVWENHNSLGNASRMARS